MPPFVIEIYWPDMTPELVARLVARAEAAAISGSTVSYVGCEVAPRDETCFLRVLAADEMRVHDFADALGLQGARVSEMVDIPSAIVTDKRPSAERGPQLLGPRELVHEAGGVSGIEGEPSDLVEQ